jgi:ABC-type multidrug transport system ATPase subunit
MLRSFQPFRTVPASAPGTDMAYRDELVERFALDTTKPTRTYSTGNRQNAMLAVGVVPGHHRAVRTATPVG